MIRAGQRATGGRTTDQIAENLAELSRSLRAVEGSSEGSLAKRTERLAERVATERFHIAVLGDFKRGKSTLINALLGQAVLPSGVVPLTSVATEVAHRGEGYDGGLQGRFASSHSDRRDRRLRHGAGQPVERQRGRASRGWNRGRIGLAGTGHSRYPRTVIGQRRQYRGGACGVARFGCRHRRPGGRQPAVSQRTRPLRPAV